MLQRAGPQGARAPTLAAGAASRLLGPKVITVRVAVNTIAPGVAAPAGQSSLDVQSRSRLSS